MRVDVNIDIDAISQQLRKLQVTIDQLHHVKQQVLHRADGLHTELKQLREENPEFKPRGLRGGKLRRLNKRGITYKSVEELSAQDHDRRLAVHKQEFLIRNKLAGLHTLEHMFEEQTALLREHQIQYQKIIGAVRKCDDGFMREDDRTLLTEAQNEAQAVCEEAIRQVEEMFTVLPDTY